MRRGPDVVVPHARPAVRLWVLMAVFHAMSQGMTDAAEPKGRPEATYLARVLPTGLGRLMVVKSDPKRGLCVSLTLLHRASEPRFPVDVSSPWQVEKVGAWLTATGDCERAQISPADAWARTASGTIRLRAEGNRCFVDLDVSVVFDARPGLRPVELMVARGIAFTGIEQPCGAHRDPGPPAPAQR